MQSNRRLLKCMQYPFAAEVNLASKGDVVILVSWLEDRKIRELEIHQREALRKDSDMWDSTFAAYLQTIGCPFPWSGMVNVSSAGDCLSWLIAHAVSAEYEDAAEACIGLEDDGNTTTAGAGHAPSSSSGSGSAAMELDLDQGGGGGDGDEAASELSAAIDKLGALVALTRSTSEHGQNNDVRFLERIARQVRLFLTAGSLQSLKTNGANDTPLHAFPAVFECGDPLVKQLATVLRMLYVSDFRELQNDLNALIVLGQEYTANPRTNSALGVVGR